MRSRGSEGRRVRERLSEPVIYDECKYAGNILKRWGNISAQELVRRFWLGTVSGVYVGVPEKDSGYGFAEADAAHKAALIDPWAMTITPVPGTLRGKFIMKLPGKPFLAVVREDVEAPRDPVLEVTLNGAYIVLRRRPVSNRAATVKERLVVATPQPLADARGSVCRPRLWRIIGRLYATF
jgi:hypothetical protein